MEKPSYAPTSVRSVHLAPLAWEQSVPTVAANLCDGRGGAARVAPSRSLHIRTHNVKRGLTGFLVVKHEVKGSVRPPRAPPLRPGGEVAKRATRCGERIRPVQGGRDDR